MNKMTMLRLVCSHLLEMPLETMYSEKSSTLSQVISGIAIAALSVMSFGYYAIHVFEFSRHKKAINLQKELEKAIEEGNCERVKDLFKYYPLLKTSKDLIRQTESDTFISLILPYPAEKGNLAMVKLLCTNGATLEAFSRGMKTPLERALDNNHVEIIKYLVDRGAHLSYDMLKNYIILKTSDLDTMIYLAQRIQSIDSKDHRGFSILGMSRLVYKQDPDKCKNLMQILIAKGDRLVEGDANFEADMKLPLEVKIFIDDQVKSFTQNQNIN